MEEAKTESPSGYKIWKNPAKQGEPVFYMGQYPPPAGQFFFNHKDLQELGFGPGHYTVLAPDGVPHPRIFSKWQKVTIPG